MSSLGSSTPKLINALMIVVLSVVASIAYGIIHDQITVRICLEYFTVFHPLIFGMQSPTVLAFLWGIVATWWVGAFLGVLLATAACAGSAPMRSAGSLVRPIGKLLMVVALGATASGVIGYFLITSGALVITESGMQRLPPQMAARFLADAFAHSGSYLVGSIGGIVLAVKVWKSRQALQEK
ncbi:MAG TPA: hypothetical protein V6C72_18925 [Chroococcales cyanobacterium]